MMSTDPDNAIKKEVEELRRDVGRILHWVRFIGFTVLALLVRSSWSFLRDRNLAPLLGVAGAILLAAFVMSRILPAKPGTQRT